MKKNLIELRKDRGLTRNFISNKLGISNRHLARIEKGQGYLTEERINKLAKIYNININEIKRAFESSNLNVREIKKLEIKLYEEFEKYFNEIEVIINDK